MTTRRSEKRMREHVAALASDDEKVAQRAEVLLIRHYGARPVELLIDACASPSEEVRFRAAWNLGKTRDRAQSKPLLRLTADPIDSVRYDATFALGHLGDPRAVEPLIRILCTPDPVHSIDSAAASALALLGNLPIPALAELAESLTKSNDPDVLVKLARILLLLKDATTTALVKSLMAHPDTRVREVAADAMEAIQEKAAAIAIEQNRA